MPQKPKDSGELAFGSRLRQLRNDQVLSLRDVERDYGINSGYLSQLERDEITKPSPSVLMKVSQAYGVPMGLLMEWVGYVDGSASGLKPNQLRALKYLGEDPTDEELDAIRAVLRVLRKNRAN